MKRAFTTSSLVLAALLLIPFGCRSSTDLSKAETQRRFGIRMAKMNLWREAMFRFQRAVELDPNNAIAYNNLAVALEATGDFEGAAQAYRTALRLDRSNEHIQKNYSRYVEFTQRSKRREAEATARTAAAAASEIAAEESAASGTAGEVPAATGTATATATADSQPQGPTPTSPPPPTDTSATAPTPETATAPPPPPHISPGGLL